MHTNGVHRRKSASTGPVALKVVRVTDAAFQGQSPVCRVTQMRPDGVHCRECAGTGPVVLKAIRVTGAAFQVLRWTSFFVCCVFSSHSFWASSSLDVPAGVTQEEGHTGFFIHVPSAMRALIFLARRIQPFLSLVDREVEFWAFLFFIFC